MTLEEIETIVDEVIDQLPHEFKKQLNNVAILVEAWPTMHDLQTANVLPSSLLFGLYTGTPKTKRTIYYSSLPDKITIFAGPILAVSNDITDAKNRIKDTVLHEIGHHFGMSEEQLQKLEKDMKKIND